MDAVLPAAGGVLILAGLFMGLRGDSHSHPISIGPFSGGLAGALVLLGSTLLVVAFVGPDRLPFLPGGDDEKSAVATTASSGPHAAGPSSAQPSGSTGMAGSSEIVVTLESPRDNESVSASQGVRAVGTVSNVGANDLWLLDAVDGYWIAEKATISAREGGHSWTALSAPLGDPAEALPFTQALVVVIASSDCSAQIQHAVEESESFLPRLPEGCIEAAKFTVTVDRP